MQSKREPDWPAFAQLALDEDAAFDDVTTQLLGDHGATVAVGRIRAENDFVVAGLPLVETVFRAVDDAVEVPERVDEGSKARSGTVVGVVRGPVRALLAGERVALNYLQVRGTSYMLRK